MSEDVSQGTPRVVVLSWLASHYLGRAMLDDAVEAFGVAPIMREYLLHTVNLDLRGSMPVISITKRGLRAILTMSLEIGLRAMLTMSLEIPTNRVLQ